MPDFASMIYGTAQNAEQNQGAGLSQAVSTGAELALQKEKLDQAQQMMQMKQQELQQEKIQRLYDFQSKAAQTQNPSDRKNLLQATIGYGNAMGLSNDIVNPKGIMSLASDENQQRMATLDTYTKLDPKDPAFMPVSDALDLATNPQKMDKFMQVPKTPLEWMGKNPNLTEAQEYVVNKQTELKKAQLEVEASKQKQQNTFSHQDENTAMTELGKFGTAIANPSTRTNLGQMKGMVDAADSVKQLTDANLPQGASKAQRIAAYDKLDSRQTAEVVKGLDRLLSRSNPTVHGNESLSPPTTIDTFLAKWGEKAGNIPEGTSQGDFIERMMGTVNRERKMNSDKFVKQSKILKDTSPMAAKIYGDRMDKAINDAASDPLGGISYKMSNGQSYTAEQLQQLRSNPNVNPKVAAEIDKVLGAQ